MQNLKPSHTGLHRPFLSRYILLYSITTVVVYYTRYNRCVCGFVFASYLRRALNLRIFLVLVVVVVLFVRLVDKT